MTRVAAADVVRRIRAAEAGPEGLNAFISLAGDVVEGQGDPIDENAPLAGVPVAVKDNIATLELPTTCGSRLLEGYRSPFEATAIRKLRAAGAVVVGKTNLDEFAMGSSTESSAFGPTRNPHDRTRVTGGSSGGSAAAVAAGYVRVALGSETGGSVRQPAAFCGVVGLKPTYGRVSRYGLVAFASSMDQIGAFGRTVVDAARLLEAVAGHDPLDATSVDRPLPELVEAAGRGVDGLVVGVPEEYLPDTLDAGIRGLIEAALERLERAGAELRTVSLPHSRFAIPTYYVLAPAEASSNLSRFDGVRYGVRREGVDIAAMHEATRSTGFGAEVKRRIMLGTYALSAGYYDRYYGRAQRARAHITRDFREVFDSGVDALFTPTTPTTAFPIGQRIDDPVEMYLSDVFTVTANLAGIPGMSVPIGSLDGLPVGGQILAPWWREDTTVRVGAALEASLGGTAT